MSDCKICKDDSTCCHTALEMKLAARIKELETSQIVPAMKSSVQCSKHMGVPWIVNTTGPITSLSFAPNGISVCPNCEQEALAVAPKPQGVGK